MALVEQLFFSFWTYTSVLGNCFVLGYLITLTTNSNAKLKSLWPGVQSQNSVSQTKPRLLLFLLQMHIFTLPLPHHWDLYGLILGTDLTEKVFFCSRKKKIWWKNYLVEWKWKINNEKLLVNMNVVSFSDCKFSALTIKQNSLGLLTTTPRGQRCVW